MRPFQRFISVEVDGSVVLLFATIAALFWANISYETYHNFWSRVLDISFMDFPHEMTMELWINDGLMSLFFLVVCLEIKREIKYGEFSSFKSASLPIVSAIGGMVVPVALFVGTLLITKQVTGIETAGFSKGWAIPMATDIAFVLGALSVLGNRIPVALKLFLMSLAIVDDLGAVLVIAFAYTSHLDITWLMWSGLLWLLLMGANFFQTRSLWFFLVVGAILWYAVLQSGIHATIAGVLLAFAIPSRTKEPISERLEDSNEYMMGRDPSLRLEKYLHPVVSYGIMPLFALANAGIVINTTGLPGIFSSVGLPIVVGLFFGKPIGIAFFAWLAVKFKLSKLPRGVRFTQIIGVGILGGIGFTMAIFISLLAFSGANQDLAIQSKLAILLSSLISAIVGLLWLNRNKYRHPKQEKA